MGKIRIGISGWSYQDWRGDFYPDTVTRDDELRYAARVFDTIEVNGTFYSLSTPDAVRSWCSAAPPGFVFAVKGSRYITHSKKLNGVETPLANFFASGILELGSMLGPVLWQLPASLHFDTTRINRFLDLLPKDTIEARNLAGRHNDKVRSVSYGSDQKHRLRHVLEIRHESYLSNDLIRVACDHGVALAFSHASTWPYVEELTAGFAYVRLHGPEEPYRSSYDDAIKVWARKICAWHQGSEPEDPKRISDRVPPLRKERDVYVYFDNDVDGRAPREAQALRSEVDRLSV